MFKIIISLQHHVSIILIPKFQIQVKLLKNYLLVQILIIYQLIYNLIGITL